MTEKKRTSRKRSLPQTHMPEIFYQAKDGALPEGFNQWEIITDEKYGTTVAHVAADFRHLPADFIQWTLADYYGETVAHIAAWNGDLPADFDQWHLADQGGWTVAHDAAIGKKLPPSFDLWGLANESGLTIADIVIKKYPKKSRLYAAANAWKNAHE